MPPLEEEERARHSQQLTPGLREELLALRLHYLAPEGDKLLEPAIPTDLPGNVRSLLQVRAPQIHARAQHHQYQ
ncbi:MAG: hypothetical protein JW384_03073 [Nitrosomonadaceae bacterium]|nr:hypothetical protein [Nitrosomonadaceae bacterium]